MLETTVDAFPIAEHVRGVYAIRIKGDAMQDALVADGDIVCLRRVSSAENGDMVAVWIKSQEQTTLKRFFNEGARVRLQPENPTLPPAYYAPDDIEIQAKVISVIRHV